MAAWRLSKTGIFIGIFVICILQFICSFVYMFLLDKNSTGKETHVSYLVFCDYFGYDFVMSFYATTPIYAQNCFLIP